MFYVIRDDYLGYEYEIIAGSKSYRNALSEMVKDVFKDRPNVDIAEIVDDIDNGEEYNDGDTKIWGDGAIVENSCRWGLTYFKGGNE